MKETDQLRNLMEALDYSNEESWSDVYVYDSAEEEITEYNFANESEYARFDQKYGFDSDSIFDFPVKRGVRRFELHNTNPPRTVIVSPDMQAIAAEVENSNE